MSDDETLRDGDKARLMISRRQALALTLGAGISATSITLAVTDPAEAASKVFLHGVASGDPRQDRVIIWTRVTQSGAGDAIPVRWTVASDEDMRKVVRSGVATAHVNRDYTVKVDVDGLAPGTTYYYRFKVDGSGSPRGRTRTLPKGKVDGLKLAVFSCSNFELGYFNAYAEAAKRDDLDAVLHLGDYIYEYGSGPGGYTSPAAAAGLVPKPRDSELVPAEEIILLDQYRARHALYKTDPALQKLHRKNPFIVVWDDHEVANDAWTGGAENHDPDTEGQWQKRKRAGIRAFYEWLPIREPSDHHRLDPETGNPDNLYRGFDFGNLARLIMLDTREAGRDRQLGTTELVAAYVGAPAEGPFPADVTDDGVERQLLGAEQEEWLANRIAGSDQTWQLIGNQVLMFYQGASDLSGTALLTDAQKAAFITLLDQVFGPGGGTLMAQLGAAGLPSPLAADAWTGYPSARVNVLAALAEAKNPVVLTGDSHNAWTANLALPTADGPLPVGVEFGGTSVSSPGFEQYLLGVPPELVAALLVDTSTRKSPNDKLVYMDAANRGFMMVGVTKERVQVDHVFVSTVFEETYTVRTQSFEVLRGTRKVQPLADATLV